MDLSVKSIHFQLTESIDLETLSDLFAGYPLRIRMLPGGIVQFLSETGLNADVIASISDLMNSIAAISTD